MALGRSRKTRPIGPAVVSSISGTDSAATCPRTWRTNGTIRLRRVARKRDDMLCAGWFCGHICARFSQKRCHEILLIWRRFRNFRTGYSSMRVNAVKIALLARRQCGHHLFMNRSPCNVIAALIMAPTEHYVICYTSRILHIFIASRNVCSGAFNSVRQDVQILLCNEPCKTSHGAYASGTEIP